MSLFDQLRGWRRQRLLEKYRISDELWASVCRDALGHYRFASGELARLREISSLFLHAKAINGARGQALDDYQRAVIAAYASLLVLELDLSWYDGWVEVIVYPESFVTRHEYVDEHGVVHEEPSVRDGESWDRGPVILSWHDLRPDLRQPGDSYNLAVHEFSHKLDQLSGVANGQPPLHKGMDPATWSKVFQQAYDRLNRELDEGREPLIDPYAAEHPAEFFAVCSEYFFEAPQDLVDFDPPLYQQLSLFYRQDPLQRLYPEQSSRAQVSQSVE